MKNLIRKILEESISEKEMEEFADGRGKGGRKDNRQRKREGRKLYANLSSLQSKTTILRESRRR